MWFYLAAIIMLSTMSMANLEPTVPIWIMDTMKAPKWQLGLIYFISTMKQTYQTLSSTRLVFWVQQMHTFNLF